MELLVITLALFTTTSAALYGYGTNSPSTSSHNYEGCSKGKVRRVDGKCVVPEIRTRLFLYDVPANIGPIYRPKSIPKLKLERNVVFVRLPEGVKGPKPIVVPPPRREHVVFVLNKQVQMNQDVIELPRRPPLNPQVYIVNYKEGENPGLPIGVDLQTALNSALQAGGTNVGSVGTIGKSGGGHSVGISGGRGRGNYTPAFISRPKKRYHKQ